MSLPIASFGDVLLVFNYAVLAYFGLITVAYLTVTCASAVEVRRYFKRRSGIALQRALGSRLTPPVTICVPAYNEAPTIVGSIRAMLTLNYPEFEVVVTNDGSKDGTLEELIEAFELRRVDKPFRGQIPTARLRGIYFSRLHDNLVVIDKENGGRADALNAAINAAMYPLVCCVDADSILGADTLLTASQPFVERPGLTIGVGGIIRVANGCTIERGHVAKVGLPRKAVPMFQTVEYLRAFLAARTGWSLVNALLIISGALGVFRRSAVTEVGGFAADSIGEDFELCVRLHRKAREEGREYSLEFVPDPICWTEVPEHLRELGGQRNRWHRGLVDTLWRHRRMIGNPRYGSVGLLALPFFVMFEFFGTFIESLGYISIIVATALGVVNWPFAVLFIVVAILSGVLLSLSAVLLEDLAFRTYGGMRALGRLIAYSVLENFGYRQIMTVYRLRGFFSYLRGEKAWGEIQRVGFEDLQA
jgi:cellulose synthase/poly-beta-1,6-N-acetylglucosamine synthase-like glycosyltransferase